LTNSNTFDLWKLEKVITSNPTVTVDVTNWFEVVGGL